LTVSVRYPPGAYLGDVKGAADLSIGEVVFMRSRPDGLAVGEGVPLTEVGPVTMSEVLAKLSSITKTVVV